ncbi:MAG TPA: transposase [Acidimicrobiales bacterium]|nr:transposase [Acidimicrobiales bacterium]
MWWPGGANAPTARPWPGPGADWATVTAIAARVVADNVDDSRFDGLTRTGVDEISWAKGYRYLTIVVDQAAGKVVWAGDGKDADVLGEFYTLLGPGRCTSLQAVPMDMGRACASATRAHTTATICWALFTSSSCSTKRPSTPSAGLA